MSPVFLHKPGSENSNFAEEKCNNRQFENYTTGNNNGCNRADIGKYIDLIDDHTTDTI